MRTNLSSGGLSSASFIGLSFGGTLIFFLGVIFPGKDSFVAIPIGLLIVTSVVKYFLIFKAIEFSDTHFFVKTVSGTKETPLQLALIHSVVFKETLLEIKRSYLLEYREADGRKEKIWFTDLRGDSLEKFTSAVRLANPNVVIDVADPFDKLGAAVREVRKKMSS